MVQRLRESLGSVAALVVRGWPAPVVGGGGDPVRPTELADGLLIC